MAKPTAKAPQRGLGRRPVAKRPTGQWKPEAPPKKGEPGHPESKPLWGPGGLIPLPQDMPRGTAKVLKGPWARSGARSSATTRATTAMTPAVEFDPLTGGLRPAPRVSPGAAGGTRTQGKPSVANRRKIQGGVPAGAKTGAKIGTTRKMTGGRTSRGRAY